jgi:hypothetical protein
MGSIIKSAVYIRRVHKASNAANDVGDDNGEWGCGGQETKRKRSKNNRPTVLR